MSLPLPVIVAGSRFGQFYAVGIHASEHYRLAGILGQGSKRTAALAHRLGVPIFTEPATIPCDIRLACVVVGGTSRGMSGVNLACQLMEQGIDVLVEHPLLPQEWEQVLRQANRLGRRCLLNSFYRNLPSVNRFIEIAGALHQRGEVRHVDMISAVQVSYAALDIVGTIVGCVAPWSVEPSSTVLSNVRDCAAVMGETPLSLRIFNELEAVDDGRMTLLMRISVITDSGTLTLSTPHSPLTWEPAIGALQTDASGLFPIFGDANASVDMPSLQYCETEPFPGWHHIHSQLWPQSAVCAVSRLASNESLQADNQRSLEISILWQQLTSALGFPVTPDVNIVPKRFEKLLSVI